MLSPRHAAGVSALAVVRLSGPRRARSPPPGLPSPNPFRAGRSSSPVDADGRPLDRAVVSRGRRRTRRPAKRSSNSSATARRRRLRSPDARGAPRRPAARVNHAARPRERKAGPREAEGLAAARAESRGARGGAGLVERRARRACTRRARALDALAALEAALDFAEDVPPARPRAAEEFRALGPTSRGSPGGARRRRASPSSRSSGRPNAGSRRSSTRSSGLTARS